MHGEIGTSEFASTFRELWSEAESGRIQICLRHWVEVEPTEKVRLSGYGVQLAVKNSEYKAVDDTKIKEGTYVCMYVHVCMHVCMNAMHVCMYVCMYVYMHACMYACMYMYVCMYVCMYVRMCVCM